MAGPTNSERIERNTDAIRSAEQTLATHEEQLRSVNGKLDGLSRDFELDRAELRQELRRLLDAVAKQNETLARHDERVKQVEQRLERRWNVLLLLVGALAGAILTIVGNVVSSWVVSGR